MHFPPLYIFSRFVEIVEECTSNFFNFFQRYEIRIFYYYIQKFIKNVIFLFCENVLLVYNSWTA